MISEALKKAQKRYNSVAKIVSIRFCVDEKPLYDIVVNKENTSKYIKDLIKKDQAGF